MSVRVRLGQLHLYKVQSVLANFSRHFLDRNGTLTNCIEGLWIVVVLEICRVVICFRSTVVLRNQLSGDYQTRIK